MDRVCAILGENSGFPLGRGAGLRRVSEGHFRTRMKVTGSGSEMGVSKPVVTRLLEGSPCGAPTPMKGIETEHKKSPMGTVPSGFLLSNKLSGLTRL